MSVPTEPGLYWARLDGKWEVVELNANPQKAPPGSTWVDAIGLDSGALVDDDCWGPRLEPPSVALTVPNDAHPLLHHLARSIEDIDAQIAKLATKRTALADDLVAKTAEWDRLQDQRARALYDGHPNP